MRVIDGGADRICGVCVQAQKAVVVVSLLAYAGKAESKAKRHDRSQDIYTTGDR